MCRVWGKWLVLCNKNEDEDCIGGHGKREVGVGAGEVGAVCEEPRLPGCVACGLDLVGLGEPCRGVTRVIILERLL